MSGRPSPPRNTSQRPPRGAHPLSPYDADRLPQGDDDIGRHGRHTVDVGGGLARSPPPVRRREGGVSAGFARGRAALPQARRGQNGFTQTLAPRRCGRRFRSNPRRARRPLLAAGVGGKVAPLARGPAFPKRSSLERAGKVPAQRPAAYSHPNPGQSQGSSNHRLRGAHALERMPNPRTISSLPSPFSL